jgi:phytoene dehydrogenase-like protein
VRETHDVVIIGGGHNGLVAALELAGAGLSVCLAEAREQVGGCATTTEPLLPNFRHNPHANSFIFADVLLPGITPADLGVTLIQPEAQLGVAFADGRPPVIIHRPDLLADTQASLGAYSRADAAKYVEMKLRSENLGHMVRRGLYGAPDSEWFEEQRQTVLDAFGPFCDEPQLGRRTARHVIDEFFTTPEIRTLLYALATETGVGLDDPGGDLAFVGFSLWIAGRWRVPVGGMQTYADALREAAQNAGAQIYVSTQVERIHVEEGRATGVRTTSGIEIGAGLAVVAAIPILNLFDTLLTSDHISAPEQLELEAFRHALPPSIGTSAFCLDWQPRYKSGRHDPQIDRCLKTVIGFDTPSDALEHAVDVRAGLLPRPAGIVRVQSLWDPTLAPSGHQIAAIDSSFPAMAALDRTTWQLIETSFPTALFKAWQRYLIDDHDEPPMTMTLDDTLGFERRMLMRLGDAQYRTSVSGLYLAGPGVYPGGGVHGACGHNAASVVIGDHHPRHQPDYRRRGDSSSRTNC